MDALSPMAIGIDLVRGGVTLWEKGGLTGHEAKAWVNAPAPWPGQQSQKMDSVDLERMPTGQPYVLLKTKGREANLLLVLGVDCSVFGDGDHHEFESTLSTEFLPPASVGSAPVDFLERQGGAAALDGIDQIHLEGSLSIENFGSRRVLVDFAGHRLYCEHSSPEERTSLILTRFCRIPVVIEKTRILVGGPLFEFMPNFKRLGGASVVSIAGCPEETIRSMMKQSTPESCAWLASFVKQVSGTFLLKYRDQDGRILEVAVAR